MTRKEAITQLRATGLYPCLVKGGIIDLNVHTYFEINDYHEQQLIVNNEFKDTKMRALAECSFAFKYSERTISRAVKYINEEI